MRRILLAGCLLALMVQSASAEKVVLKSGRVLEGKITSQSDEYITVDVKGVSHTYKMEAVAVIGEVAEEAVQEAAPSVEILEESPPVIAEVVETEAVVETDVTEEEQLPELVEEMMDIEESQAVEVNEEAETFEALEVIEDDVENEEVETVEGTLAIEVMEEAPAVEEVEEIDAIEEAQETAPLEILEMPEALELPEAAVEPSESILN